MSNLVLIFMFFILLLLSFSELVFVKPVPVFGLSDPASHPKTTILDFIIAALSLLVKKYTAYNFNLLENTCSYGRVFYTTCHKTGVI